MDSEEPEVQGWSPLSTKDHKAGNVPLHLKGSAPHTLQHPLWCQGPSYAPPYHLGPFRPGLVTISPQNLCWPHQCLVVMLSLNPGGWQPSASME